MGVAKKILISLALLIVLLSVHLPITRDPLFHNSFFKKLDALGLDYIDESLTRSAAAFALARAANAFISVLQESEVQATLFGTGVTLALGQTLDPVNDLIERFSWVMLVSTISLGVQKFFIEFGSWLSVPVLLSLALSVLLVGLWTFNKEPLFRLGLKLILAAVLVRFIIPLAGLANKQVYEVFLENEYEQSMVNMEMEEFKAGVIGESSFWNEIKEFDMTDKIEALQEKMTELTQYVINLIIVFFIQNVVLPLLTAWLVIRALKLLTGRTAPYIIDRGFLKKAPAAE